MEKLSREEFLRRREQPGVAVVNVLPPEAYAGGHIPGSISLPLAEIRERAREALPDPEQEIILYCGGPT